MPLLSCDPAKGNPERLPSGSGGKFLAATGAAGGENLAATDCCHTRTEAVAMFADELARLVGPFHVSVSADKTRTATRMGAALKGLTK